MNTSGLSILITGATGMVGEGVLHTCIQCKAVSSIKVLGRRSCGVVNPKVTEVLHDDFLNLEPVADQLTGIDACFFCLGVSSVGLSEAQYTRLTHSLTLHAAGILSRQNPSMTFVYVSGAGTDSSEKGKVMWARVKGKTENDLQKLPFKAAFAFRPGYLHPIEGLRFTLPYYKWFMWMYPALRMLLPAYVGTLEECGRAMIAAAKNGYHKPVVEVTDISALSATLTE
jgi:uncharacterized protein YbjT (DUF2867 family)